MKLTVILFLLTFTFCTIENTRQSDRDKIKKEDITGTWVLSQQSLQILKDQGAEANKNAITRFQLHADSTTSIFFGNISNPHEIKGIWKSNVKKGIGNKNFGLSLSMDVLIKTHKTKSELFCLGLQLSEKDGKIILTAGKENTYEKVDE